MTFTGDATHAFHKTCVLLYQNYQVLLMQHMLYQITFVPGRNIMEGVVILHETIHEMHRKKMNGVILKLDFEKAYDKVKWEFLQQMLKMKGFLKKWCQWIDQFVNKGSVGIKANDDVGQYMQTKKG
jgi:hypothetical protein